VAGLDKNDPKKNEIALSLSLSTHIEPFQINDCPDATTSRSRQQQLQQQNECHCTVVWSNYNPPPLQRSSSSSWHLLRSFFIKNSTIRKRPSLIQSFHPRSRPFSPSLVGAFLFVRDFLFLVVSAPRALACTNTSARHTHTQQQQQPYRSNQYINNCSGINLASEPVHITKVHTV
jgi:hypothetical protein